MKRIMIIGSAGAGKSTLARTLHTITKLPVIHLDSLFWKPEWRETPKATWIALQQDIVQGEEWIIDGTYQSTIDIRLEAADAVIFLDMPSLLCLWRVIKRHILYWRRLRPDLAKGCPEKITWGYLDEVRNFPNNERGTLIEKLFDLKNQEQKQVIWLTSVHAVSAFVKELRAIYEKV
jgi:adenylate kinase family enzyme